MTDSQTAPRGHVVAAALPVWGHTKPLCALSAKIVRLRRVYVTLLTDAILADKVFDEVERQFASQGEEDLKSLIRIVSLPASPMPLQFDLYKAGIVNGYKTLYAGEAISTSPDAEDLHDPIPAPQAVILDFLLYEALEGIRSVSGTSVPIYAWQPGGATPILFMFGPESLGGNGDLAVKISKITTQDPDARKNEIVAVHRNINGKVVRLPGIPPMYDYEHVPQISALPIHQADVAITCQYNHRFFSQCDGVIHNASRLLEGEALKTWESWYGAKPVIALGPLSPPANAVEMEKEKTKSSVGEEVAVFLNNAFDKFGPNSVVYISFGTVLWSAEPEKIWTVVDALLEQEIPFLFSYASPVAVIPEKMSARIKASGLGYLAKWLPQQMILHHKACGWSMTHCGHNSVMESLTAGVPLICWPYDSDQPSNAANIVYTHGAGFELLEVRNGHGLRPLHRLGNKAPTGTTEAVRLEIIELFEKARGVDGEAKRAKARWFSEKFAEDWNEGGSAWGELRKVVDILD